MRYTGRLHAEPNEFSMIVEDMSVRHNEIGIDIQGHIRDNGLPYVFNGTAVKQREGHFRADSRDCVEGVEYETHVYIFQPTMSMDGCEIEGFWYERRIGEEPQVWRFSGSLAPL